MSNITVNLEIVHQAIQTVLIDNKAVERNEWSLALLLEKVTGSDLCNGIDAALKTCFDGRKVS